MNFIDVEVVGFECQYFPLTRFNNLCLAKLDWKCVQKARTYNVYNKWKTKLLWESVEQPGAYIRRDNILWRTQFDKKWRK